MNPWENDPIVRPANSTPWQNDPVVRPAAPALWENDPIVGAAPASSPRLNDRDAAGRPLWQTKAFAQINSTPGLSKAGRMKVLNDWQTAAQGDFQQNYDKTLRPGDYSTQTVAESTPTSQFSPTSLLNDVPQALDRYFAGPIVGIFDPDLSAKAKQGLNLAYPTAPGIATDVIQGGIGMAPSLAIAGLTGGTSVLPTLSAIGGATGIGEGRTEAAERRAAGENVSLGQEAGLAAGHGAINAAANYFGGKVAGEVVPGLVGKIASPLLRYPVAVAADVGANAALGAGQQVGSNLVDKAAGVENAPGIFANAGQAALAGAGQGLAFAPLTVAGVHDEAVERQNAAHAQRVAELTGTPPEQVQIVPRPSGKGGVAARYLADNADKPVIFFSGADTRAGGMNTPDAIYINADRGDAVPSILAHEVLGHSDQVAVASALEHFAQTNPRLQKLGEQAYSAEAAGSEIEPSPQRLPEEGTARALEEIFKSPDLQKQLADQNPTLASHIADIARKSIDAVAGTNLQKGKVVERQLKMLEPLFERTRQIQAEEGLLDAVEPQMQAQASQQQEAAAQQAQAQDAALQEQTRQADLERDQRIVEGENQEARQRFNEQRAAEERAGQVNPPQTALEARPSDLNAPAEPPPSPPPPEQGLTEENQLAERRARALNLSEDQLRRMPGQQLKQVAEDAGVHFDARSTTIPRILEWQHAGDLAQMSNKELYDAVRARGLRAGNRQANLDTLLNAQNTQEPIAEPAEAGSQTPNAPQAQEISNGQGQTRIGTEISKPQEPVGAQGSEEPGGAGGVDRAQGLGESQIPKIGGSGTSEALNANSGVRNGPTLDMIAHRLVVQPEMLRSLHDPEVLNSVISRVPVDVVNMLGGKQIATKVLRHDPSVFLEALSANENSSRGGTTSQQIGASPDTVTSSRAKIQSQRGLGGVSNAAGQTSSDHLAAPLEGVHASLGTELGRSTAAGGDQEFGRTDSALNRDHSEVVRTIASHGVSDALTRTAGATVTDAGRLPAEGGSANRAVVSSHEAIVASIGRKSTEPKAPALSLEDQRIANQYKASETPKLPGVEGEAKFSVGPGNARGVKPSPAPTSQKPKESLAERLHERIRPGRTEGERFTLRNESEIDIARRKLEDEFLPIRHAIEDVKRQGGEVMDESDVGLRTDIFQGRAGERLRKLTDDRIKPIIDLMSKNGITQPQVDQYLIALHAPERNATIAQRNPDLPDGGSGMTTADADRIRQEVESGPKAQAYKHIADQVHQMNRDTLSLQRGAGLISPEAYDQLSNQWQNYVPLRHDVDEGMGNGTGQGFSIRGKEYKAATGRTTEADSPLGFSIQQAQQKIVRAEKNHVAQAMLNFVRQNPDKGLWEIDPNPPMVRDIDPKSGMVVERIDPRFKFADNIVAAKEGGKTHLIIFKGDAGAAIARAMKRVGVNNANRLTRMMQKPMRVYRELQTNLNPGFMLPNLVRDAMTAGINLSAEQSKGMAARMLKGIAPSAKAMFDIIGNHEAKIGSARHDYAREYLAAGGKVDSYAIDDFSRIQKNLASLLKDANPSNPRRMLLAAKQAGQWIDRINGAVENGTRLSAYIEARKSGMTPERAAELAKNLTVNFNRKGEIGSGLNTLYMFSNAGVQGDVRMLKALATTKTGRRIAAGIALSGLAYGLALPGLLGKDKEGRDIYDTIPDWEKDNNLIIPTGGGKYVKLPLPYGYSALFTAGRLAADASSGHATPGQATVNLIGAAADAFDPLGAGGSLADTLSPTLAKPIIEASENKNWMGREIRPEQPPYGPTVPYSQLAWRTTSPYTKAVAQWLNKVTGGDEITPGKIDVSPAMMDHFIGFATGGLGRFIQRAGELPEKATEGTLDADALPIARRFVGQESPNVNQTEFYDLSKKIDAAMNAYKHYRDTQQLEKMRQSVKDNRRELRLVGAMKEAKKRLAQLRKYRDTAEARGNAKAVKEIERRMEAIYGQVDQAYRKAG